MANSERETKRPPLLFLLLILFLFISFFFFYLNFFTFIINTSFIVCFICRFVFFFLLVFISVLRHHLLPPPLVPIHFLCYHLLNLRPLLHLPRPLLLMRWTSAVPSFLIQWRREEVSKLDYIKVQRTETQRQTDKQTEKDSDGQRLTGGPETAAEPVAGRAPLDAPLTPAPAPPPAPAPAWKHVTVALCRFNYISEI